MPLTNHGLDKLIAQHMSKLTDCHPRSLDAEFPNRSGWYGQFVLRQTFTAHIADDFRPLAFVLLRRADAAIDEWNVACSLLAGNVQSAYDLFNALRHLENCISACWQGIEFARRAAKIQVFKPGDGSQYQRLNAVYNHMRHHDPLTLPAEELHALWLSNEALHITGCSIAFEEMRSMVGELGRVAVSLAQGRSAAPQSPVA